MADEAVFMQGIFVKDPHANAPDFVLAKVSFKVEDVCEFLRANANDAGYVNSALKRGKSGKMYLELDTWKPDPSRRGGDRGSRQQESAGVDDQAGIADDVGEQSGLPF